MLSWLIAILLGGAAVVAAYRGATAFGALTRLAAAARLLAVTAIVALLINAPVGGTLDVRPLVVLDVSASWLRGRDTAVFAHARDAALAAAGDSVLAFGDSLRRASAATLPGDNSSGIRAVAERAIAAGRPLVIYTDGELDDAAALEALPKGSRVVLGDSSVTRDAAVGDLRAPRGAGIGDTVEVRVTIVAGSLGSGPGRVALTLNGREVAGARLDSLGAWGERVVTLRFVARGAGGDAELRATVVADGDAEPRNDEGATVLDVGSTAAAVMVSTSPDLDSRELAAVLRGTVSLPTRAYLRVAPGVWREDGTLGAVSEAVVRAAARESPLVVLHGDTAIFGSPRTATRGSLALIVPPAGDPGEWFATAAPVSPVAAALSGTPWDSLPPLEVSASSPVDADFELLETRRARRLERRVAMSGWERPRRVVVVGASGFWRWRFRGGAGADAYAAVWGSTLDWLAGEGGDVRRAVPGLASRRAGEVIPWRRGTEADSIVPVTLRGRGRANRVDTLMLRFGSSSATETPSLSAGTYEVTSAGGTSLLVVNPSRELLPRRPSVRPGPYGRAAVAGAAPRARDWPWIFGVALFALCAEWVLRRRAGLR